MAPTYIIVCVAIYIPVLLGRFTLGPGSNLPTWSEPEQRIVQREHMDQDPADPVPMPVWNKRLRFTVFICLFVYLYHKSRIIILIYLFVYSYHKSIILIIIKHTIAHSSFCYAIGIDI